MGLSRVLSAASLLVALVAASVAAAQSQPPQYQYNVPRGVQAMGSFAQLRIPSLEAAIANGLRQANFSNAVVDFVGKSAWSMSYAFIFTSAAIFMFLITLIFSCVECCSHTCYRKRGWFSNPRDSYASSDKSMSRSLVMIAILAVMVACAGLMYANVALFMNIPSTMQLVNTTIADTSSKFEFVLGVVKPIAADNNIDIPQQISEVDQFMQENTKIVSTASADGISWSSTAKILGALPWILPLIAALLALPFYVRVSRGFAKASIVASFVSLFLVLALMTPYTMIGFTTTSECASNLRLSLVDYASNSTGDACATNLLQYYLLCVPLNQTGSCDPVDELQQNIVDAIDQLTQLIDNANNTNNPNRQKWISDREALNTTLPVVASLATCNSFNMAYVDVERVLCNDVAGNSAIMFEILFYLIFILPLLILSLLMAFYRLEPGIDIVCSEFDSYQSLDHYGKYSGNDSIRARKLPMVLTTLISVLVVSLIVAGFVISVTVGSWPITIGA